VQQGTFELSKNNWFSSCWRPHKGKQIFVSRFKKNKHFVFPLRLFYAGDKNVVGLFQAASVVIPDKSQASIEKAIRKLKDCSFDESRSVALAFICCARGKYFFHQVKIKKKIKFRMKIYLSLSFLNRTTWSLQFSNVFFPQFQS